jgi:hypothetical protein
VAKAASPALLLLWRLTMLVLGVPPAPGVPRKPCLLDTLRCMDQSPFPHEPQPYTTSMNATVGHGSMILSIITLEPLRLPSLPPCSHPSPAGGSGARAALCIAAAVEGDPRHAPPHAGPAAGPGECVGSVCCMPTRTARSSHACCSCWPCLLSHTSPWESNQLTCSFFSQLFVSCVWAGQLVSSLRQGKARGLWALVEGWSGAMDASDKVHALLLCRLQCTSMLHAMTPQRDPRPPPSG